LDQSNILKHVNAEASNIYQENDQILIQSVTSKSLNTHIGKQCDFTPLPIINRESYYNDRRYYQYWNNNNRRRHFKYRPNIKGFLLNFINVGVLLGWLGFIVIGNSLTETNQELWVFLGTILAVYFLVDLLKIIAAKTLKSKLTPRRIFKTKKIVSLVILGFGILLLVQGFFPEEKELIKDKLEQINPIKK